MSHILHPWFLDVEINEEIKEMQQELLEKLEKLQKKGEKTSQMMGNLDTQKKVTFDQIDKFFQEVI